jgi:hypothetical protein
VGLHFSLHLLSNYIYQVDCCSLWRQVELRPQSLELPEELLLVEGALEAEVAVLLESLPEQHVNALEGFDVKVQPIPKQFLNGVQTLSVVDVHVYESGLIRAGV